MHARRDKLLVLVVESAQAVQHNCTSLHITIRKIPVSARNHLGPESGQELYTIEQQWDVSQNFVAANLF